MNVNYGMLDVVFSAKSARTLAHQIPALPPKTELACLECFPSGLTFYDIYGTRRFVPHDPVRTGNLPVPLGESPVYVVGPKGIKAQVRPDPGW